MDYLLKCIILLIQLSCFAVTLARAGCRGLDVSTCCPGKNNTCKADGPRLNNLFASTCFCDDSCIEIGDCCTDYATACPVVDCQLSEDWSDWGECSSSCGPGYKVRSRVILVKPANGGRPCDATTEKIYCEGEKCKVVRHEGFDLLKERARIIPAKFGSWRKNKMYNPYEDIRKNLFEHYAYDKAPNQPSYCASFEVIDVHGACHKSSTSWTAIFKRGAVLCVECQPFSVKPELGGRCMGHGVLNKATYWKAMTVHGCHGKWVMIKQHEEECSCESESDKSFIFI